MKKAIVIILTMLPIFLILTISLAGRIIAEFVYVNVESVVFVDENDEPYDKEAVIKVGVGKELQLKVVVLPEKANNKRVKFSANKNSFISVDESGLVRGLDYGRATVVVETEERQKKATINILVTDEYVSGVTLNHTEISLAVGESFSFDKKFDVFPATALNKKVSWSSSDTSKVTVNAAGMVMAKAVTGDDPVIVTVTTVDGGFTASCAVTVRDDAVLKFKQEWFIYSIINLPDNTVDLLDCIIFDDERISLANIRFEIVSGINDAEILADGTSMKFSDSATYSVMVYVRAIDIRNEELFVEAKFLLYIG